ncbi:TBC1 domain family member 17 isoform X1 [Carcharodon carcharias]|uniref:TBC1 domain family member 17 isoform X1 n=2 Tax=Carcharodon carcharias TaxID=13397 RepID=UPI001B7F5442|nr:TBC1 domain family member 17 isoform X1 [Carcharodon carcharias]
MDPSGDLSPGSSESSRRGLGVEEREALEERPAVAAAGEGRWLRGCMELPLLGRGGAAGLSPNIFPLLFDLDGRLVRESQFRKLIFKEGGVDPSIRKDVWKFLFGMYPCTSTTRERKALALELYVRYKMMKCRWQTLMPSSRRMRVDETDTELYEAALAYQQTGGACNLKEQKVDLSEEKSEQMTFIELQAKVYVDRQRINVHELHEAIRIIDKDVPRTERDLDYYQNEGAINLMVLRDILITFAAFHPDVSYAQGMNDLVSRFLEVLDSEVDAYWCSTFYFEKVSLDFKEEGLIRKIRLEEQLLKELDSQLYAHLLKDDMNGLTFCHRWLLLGFQREFEHSDAIRLFEILSSHHLELSSLEAESARHSERMTHFQREEGKIRPELPLTNNDYTFELFICAAILLEKKELLLKCSDEVELIQFTNSLQGALNLDRVLERAEQAFFNYCNKSVMDCFKKLCTEPKKKGFFSFKLMDLFS